MSRPQRSTFQTGPVTALCVVNDKVLAGVGSSLYLYSLDQGCCTQQCSKVLPCTNIHGIRSASATGKSSDSDISLLCAFGGKCLRLVEYLSETLQCKEDVISVPDWIWDVSWLYKAGEVDSVAVITAHNVVHRLDLKDGRTIQQSVACVENSILYCARFINSSWEGLIVAAGTVFNQILLWSPVGDRNDAGQALVIHRLVGHEGVIFSVEFCPCRRWICSVSDDRSIRVWQLNFPDSVDEVISLDHWKHCCSEQLFLLYGHSARVWDIKILTHNLISIGEDSTCCVWDDHGKIIHKFKGHKGKSIWSLAVDNTGKFVVTGGGDNSIRLWKLDMIHKTQNNDTLTCTTLAVPDTQGIKVDFPRVVTMVDWNHTLVLTNEGVLQLHALDTSRWRTLMYDTAFRSYTTIVVCPYQANLVALGNITGMLRIFFCRNLGSGTSVQDADWLHKDWQVHDGKIFSLQWLSHDRLLTTGADGQIKYWEFELTEQTADLELGGSFVLPPCKHWWVSAAGIVEESDMLLLICGDRGGTVHVYHLYTEEQDRTPIQSFPKIHGKTGVTDICCHGNIVYTAGRDGFYNQYEIAGNQLCLLHKNKVHRGFDWLDKLDIHREDGDTLIYGFHSNNFVLWSVLNNQQLVQIPCGGGHRAWDCRMANNSVRFVYIKAGDVICCETKLWSNQTLLKESLHGREITDVQHLMTYAADRHTVEVIATCSEDTQINLLCIAPNRHGIHEMKVLQTLQGHISSVRTITHCNSGLPCQQKDGHKKLLFSGGGRAQLLVWRVEISRFRSPKNDKAFPGIKCSFESLLNYRMERWNRKHRKPWKQLTTKPNPETRFMDLAVMSVQDVWLSAPPGVFCVIAACSDGYVRFYLFCERERTLTLLGQSPHHNHCVLKVDILKYQSQGHIIAMSAATDGCIAFWDITHLYQHHLHQSEQLLQINANVLNNSSYHVTCNSSEDTNVKVTSDGCDTKQTHPCSNVCDSKQMLSEVDHVQEIRVPIEQPNVEENVASVCNDGDVKPNTTMPPGDKFVHNTQEQTTYKSGSEDENLRPIFVIPSHQSGINSLHSVPIQGTDQILIASGGDDNAVRLSKVAIATGPAGVHITQHATGIKPSAHAAQITGIHLINKEQLITASVDQRLCLWDIVATKKDFQLQQKWCRFVDVADLSSICVWKTDRVNILTAGVGLEILTTDPTND